MGYEINWESESGVVKRFFGKICGSDLVDAVLDTQADARFASVRYVINDYLAVEQASFDDAVGSYISALYGAASLSNPRIRIAFVVTSPQIAAVATAYADSPRNVFPARTFATLTAARRWLESSDEVPAPAAQR